MLFLESDSSNEVPFSFTIDVKMGDTVSVGSSIPAFLRIPYSVIPYLLFHPG
jgi:hypothetical protein